MNRERTLLAVFALVGAYLAGYYQVTPTYLYSLASKPASTMQSAQSPSLVKPAQTRTVMSPQNSAVTAAEPTPWPTPWPAPGVAER